MRVLFWSDLYWPYIGGAEVFASKLMAALRPKGVEFLVITSHHDRELADEDEYDGITIRRLPYREAIGGRDARAVLRAMKETAAIKRAFAPDLIHMNAIGPSALFYLRSLGSSSAPLLVTLQQEVLPSQAGGSASLMSQLLETAWHVVGCSETVLEQVRAAHPEVRGRSSRIYNGVDVPPQLPAPLPATPHVLALGRLVPAKGFDVALRAFAIVATAMPHVRFTMAGDGAGRDDLLALATELGLGGRVAMPGWIDPGDVPQLLNEASVVVMPSRREGLPIVAVQAALMARPIVATAAGGLREIVQDRVTGRTVRGEDEHAVAAAILELLGDRRAAEALGAQARAHVLRALDWDQTVTSYHDLYVQSAEHLQLHDRTK